MDRELAMRRVFKLCLCYIPLMLGYLLLRQYSPIIFKDYELEENFLTFIVFSIPVLAISIFVIDYFKNWRDRYWFASFFLAVGFAFFTWLTAMIFVFLGEGSNDRERILYEHKYYSDRKIILEENYDSHQRRIIMVSDFTPWFQWVREVDINKVDLKRWKKVSR
ncbi:hypothetical protein EV198_1727 [Roseivirga ehrenbergii]|uniref:Uncharacterized protein n=3 Tax=Roseivirga ehrenbergii (strain DSM 102268 / JCM 13514 / KCTC 12282 / NCIMB 14502 / KMM 6017) TaxID=279360 RepID=A0A150XS33_ROSEK|nr:hypothetical protein MB14_13180 [Roseivirga ehrenbergii]TCL10695.1 hypothetical protein EV198_1727 [Roseivirga ehrenbergii]